MLIQTLAHEIHENAVRHGWYEDNREYPEIAALIHSEWSEALEEARAGRPLVYKLDIGDNELRYIVPTDPAYNVEYSSKQRKPEGVAVELIDGVIRILDYMGHVGAEIVDPESGFPANIEELWETDNILEPEEIPLHVPTLVAYLHVYTSETMSEEKTAEDVVTDLLIPASLALIWVNRQGIDPLKLLLEKHAYNKNRPYKHGKQF